MPRILKRGIESGLLLLTILLQGCIYEYPEPCEDMNVRLHITHRLPWLESEYDYDPEIPTGITRADNTDWKAKYFVKVYPHGNVATPSISDSFERRDLSLEDFEREITLSGGTWDIYVWQHFERKDAEPPHYDVTDFSAVTYNDSCRGASATGDAFEGRTIVVVPYAPEGDNTVIGEIAMERPLARYVFIATDFEEFYNDSMTRFGLPQINLLRDSVSFVQQKEALKDFSVTTRYPLFMPAVYNLLTQKVTDSRRDVHFKSPIIPLSVGEAMVSNDDVFIDHHEGGVQVQLGMILPNGMRVDLIPTITVPLRRGEITYVKGRFLTTRSGSGLEIDYSFSGDINIQIP